MRFTGRRNRPGRTAGAIGLAVLPLAGFAMTAAAAPAAAPIGQPDADALRSAALSTGAVVVIKDSDTIEQFGSGTTRFLDTDVPDGDDQFRVASNTKMYVSTVLLQLADEGAVDLDAPIGDYLPGLVAGTGIDESAITVRQLLQHTSGLADNLTPDVIFNPIHQWIPPTPETMVALGVRHGAGSDAGSTFLYSNTAYVVLGLLVEELTGQRVGDAIDARIVDPLGLEETSYAYAGEKEIDGPHFSGYLGVTPLLFEVSGHEPGLWAGAGALLSSGSDMTTFLDALLAGELLSEEMLAEMQTTFADSGYGLGIGSAELSCGVVWGHSGHVPGYTSFTFADGDGRAVFAAVNASTTDLNSPTEEINRIIDTALCGADATGTVTLSDGLLAEIDHGTDIAESRRNPAVSD